MIKTIELNKTFRTNEIETIALDKITLEIMPGEFVAIMGPSGCGKTTLLNILGLLDEPTRGQYFFLNTDVNRLSKNQKAQLRKGKIGFIFQNFNLIDELNVYENIELPLIYMGVNPSKRKEKVEAMLDEMRLMHRKKYFPSQLSGGQQQQVAIARAMVADPEIILADEPTGNLDSAHGDEVMYLLSELNKNGTTIIMVTHSKRDADYAKRVVNLFDGQIIAENLYQGI